MKLTVVRDCVTDDAHFGSLSIDDIFECRTMERTSVMIPTGTYPITFQFSPHFQEITPHLSVPGRTYIEIHPANKPTQLEGCIAVGKGVHNDFLLTSRDEFDHLMSKIKDQADLTITIS